MFCWVKLDLILVVSEQLLPDENSLQDNGPLDNCPLDGYPLDYCSPDNCPRGKMAPRQFPQRTFSPERNCTPPPWMIVPGSLLLEGNCLLTICPWKLSPVKSGFWMICCLHNYRSDKWSRGKLLSRKITARINYTRCIFSPRVRNISTLISSCFLLFSFFVV